MPEEKINALSYEDFLFIKNEKDSELEQWLYNEYLAKFEKSKNGSN